MALPITQNLSVFTAQPMRPLYDADGNTYVLQYVTLTDTLTDMAVCRVDKTDKQGNVSTCYVQDVSDYRIGDLETKMLPPEIYKKAKALAGLDHAFNWQYHNKQ